MPGDPGIEPQLSVCSLTATDIFYREGAYDKAAALLSKAGCDSACIDAAEEIEGVPRRAGSFEAWLKAQHDPPDPLELAYAYTHLGRNDQALESLEKAYAQRTHTDKLVFLGVDPGFDTLRSDLRFHAFLSHAGLPPQPKTLVLPTHP